MFCEDAAEGARWGLLALMTGISQEAWCAGWMTGLENELWRAATGLPGPYGRGVVTQRQADLLRLLSDEADGWWVYDADRGPTFLPIDEWLRRAA